MGQAGQKRGYYYRVFQLGLGTVVMIFPLLRPALVARVGNQYLE
jgi:hypothetical protein